MKMRKEWAQFWAKSKGAAAGAPSRDRMGAKITEVDGIKFRSRLEADRYKELKLLKAAGEVKYFLRQVPFDVAPGVVYRCDFYVVYNTYPPSEPGVEDTKGFLTDTSRVKIKVVEDRYGLAIRILRREDVRKC